MDERFSRLLACLPPAVRREILRISAGQGNFLCRLFEIRLRAGRVAALTLDGRTLPLSVIATPEEVRATFRAFCAQSVYAHSESLRDGFLTYEGFRIGVAGRAVYDGGRVSGIGEVSSLCIRIPHAVRGAGDTAREVFFRLGGREGILVYSPPGVGKTTLLRDLGLSLSCGHAPLRVALVDTRGELLDENAPVTCQIDVLTGYPLALGIEIATRTLAPDVILCDEIGSYAEAEAILTAQGCGVPIVASAHAGGVDELLARPPIRLLHENAVFGAYIGICAAPEGYRYTVDYRTPPRKRRE